MIGIGSHITFTYGGGMANGYVTHIVSGMHFVMTPDGHADCIVWAADITTMGV